MALLNQNRFRIIQFGDLVIDSGNYTDPNYTATWKINSSENDLGHGVYLPERLRYLDATSVDMEIEFNLRYVKCYLHQQLRRFVERELSGRQRLWAINGSELMWTWAEVESVSRPYNKGRLSKLFYSVKFLLVDGVWRYADRQKVFLDDWYLCEFEKADCKHGIDNRCPTQCGTCANCKTNQTCLENCAVCDSDGCCKYLCSAEGVCGMTDLQLEEALNDRCVNPKRIIYSCGEAYNRYGRYAGWGQQFWSDQANFSGNFHSDTILPTTEAVVRLQGKFTNPKVIINDQYIQLTGTYDGLIEIDAKKGTIWYSTNRNLLVNKQNLLSQATFSDSPFFTINPGKNFITVLGGEDCKGKSVYVYYERWSY
jgi:hypothetical protein